MSTEPLLDRDLLRRAFSALNRRLQRRGVSGDVFVFGGAAMVLGFDARPATRDVDAVWEPHTAVLEEAWAVADELQLPRSWLNEQASSYLPAHPARTGAEAVENDGAALRVTAASAELLLAMKARAARRGDLPDVALLARHLGLASVSAVIEVAERVFSEALPMRQRMVLEDMFTAE